MPSREIVARRIDFERDSPDVIGFLTDAKVHTVDLLKSAVDDGHAFVHVAEMDGRVVGWTAVRTAYREDTGWSPEGSTALLTAGTDAYLEFFEVAAPLRGQGIGTALLGATDREAVRLEKERLWLHTSEQNEGARRLYERNGWALVDTIHPPWNGGRAMTLYKKELV